MSNENELLPCPFCGGEGAYQTDTEDDDFSEEWIGCLECGATAALEVWNRRAEPAPSSPVPVEAVGWKLVPLKVTDQMYVAFREQLESHGHISRFVEAYEAMLSAAPAYREVGE